MKRFDIFSGNPVVLPDGRFCAYAEVEKRDARIAELEAEALAWMKCARDNQEMLNTIGRLLGGQIPEQLVSEVAHERMAEIADLIHPHDLATYRAKKSLHK